MAVEVKMPQLGLTMEEGTVSKWVKQEGDAVKVGDVPNEWASILVELDRLERNNDKKERRQCSKN